MAFLALKPCSFAGKSFKIGERIPEGAALPEMVPRLIKMGKIAKAPETEAKTAKTGAETARKSRALTETESKKPGEA